MVLRNCELRIRCSKISFFWKHYKSGFSSEWGGEEKPTDNIVSTKEKEEQWKCSLRKNWATETSENAGEKEITTQKEGVEQTKFWKFTL